MQFPTADNAGVHRVVSHPFQSASNLSSDIVLLLCYSDVPPYIFPKSDPIIPMIQCPMLKFGANTAIGYDWLDKVRNCIQSNSEPENVSYAAYPWAETWRRIWGDQKIFSRPNFRKNFHFQGKNF